MQNLTKEINLLIKKEAEKEVKNIIDTIIAKINTESHIIIVDEEKYIHKENLIRMFKNINI